MWEIYTYGGGDYLVQVFGAVALFFGGPFQSLAQVAGLFGLTAILMSYLGPRHNIDLAYILRFAVFYGALFVPKADIAVVDRITPVAGGGVVAQVPFGLAMFAHFTSYIGDRLTTAYETAMSFPADQRYAQNGMVFGATMLKKAPQVTFSDATFSGDMSSFLDICAAAMFASDPTLVEQVEKSQDVWGLLKGLAQANRFVQISSFADPVTCETAAQDLDARMANEEARGLANLGKVMWPYKTFAVAQADASALLAPTANDLAGIAMSSSQMVRQAMMINAIEAGLDRLPPTETSGAMASIQAKTAAEKQRSTVYMTMGAVAARAIPLMRSILEAIAYALFPVVAIMILMPMGLMAFLNYFIVLMWLQMWPVLYAVLNSLIYFYSQQANTTGAMMPTGLTDWTMWSLPGIMETNSEIVALAGYMAISIPMISYMLVRGGAHIGSQVAAQLMQPAQQAASQAGSQAAMGNWQLGVVGMNTLTAENRSVHTTSEWNRSYGNNTENGYSSNVKTWNTTNANKHDTTSTHRSGSEGNTVTSPYGSYTTDGNSTVTGMRVNSEQLATNLAAYYQNLKQDSQKSGFELAYTDKEQERRVNSLASTLNKSQIEEMQRRHGEGVEQGYQAVWRWLNGGKFDASKESSELRAWYDKLDENERRALQADLGLRIGADGRYQEGGVVTDGISRGQSGAAGGSKGGTKTPGGVTNSWQVSRAFKGFRGNLLGILLNTGGGVRGVQDNATNYQHGGEERHQASRRTIESMFAAIERAAIKTAAEKTSDEKVKAAADRWQASLDDRSAIESSRDLELAQKQSAGREKLAQEQAGLRMTVADPLLIARTAERMVREENPHLSNSEVFGEVVRRLNQSPEFVYAVAQRAYWENREGLQAATWANKIPEPDDPDSVTDRAKKDMNQFRIVGKSDVRAHHDGSRRDVAGLTDLGPNTPLPVIRSAINEVQRESERRYAALKDGSDVMAATNNVVTWLYKNNEGGFLSGLSYALFFGLGNKSPKDYENIILTAAERSPGFREQLKRFADAGREPSKEELEHIFRTAGKLAKN